MILIQRIDTKVRWQIEELNLAFASAQPITLQVDDTSNGARSGSVAKPVIKFRQGTL